MWGVGYLTSRVAPLQREDQKERERERILGMVKDPREKQRLHKLFAIERERAKEAILRLSA